MQKVPEEPILISNIEIIYNVPQNHPFFFLSCTYDSVDIERLIEIIQKSRYSNILEFFYPFTKVTLKYTVEDLKFQSHTLTLIQNRYNGLIYMPLLK